MSGAIMMSSMVPTFSSLVVVNRLAKNRPLGAPSQSHVAKLLDGDADDGAVLLPAHGRWLVRSSAILASIRTCIGFIVILHC